MTDRQVLKEIADVKATPLADDDEFFDALEFQPEEEEITESMLTESAADLPDLPEETLREIEALFSPVMAILEKEESGRGVEDEEIAEVLGTLIESGEMFAEGLALLLEHHHEVVEKIEKVAPGLGTASSVIELLVAPLAFLNLEKESAAIESELLRLTGKHSDELQREIEFGGLDSFALLLPEGVEAGDLPAFAGRTTAERLKIITLLNKLDEVKSEKRVLRANTLANSLSLLKASCALFHVASKVAIVQAAGPAGTAIWLAATTAVVAKDMYENPDKWKLRGEKAKEYPKMCKNLIQKKFHERGEDSLFARIELPSGMEEVRAATARADRARDRFVGEVDRIAKTILPTGSREQQALESWRDSYTSPRVGESQPTEKELHSHLEAALGEVDESDKTDVYEAQAAYLERWPRYRQNFAVVLLDRLERYSGRIAGSYLLKPKVEVLKQRLYEIDRTIETYRAAAVKYHETPESADRYGKMDLAFAELQLLLDELPDALDEVYQVNERARVYSEDAADEEHPYEKPIRDELWSELDTLMLQLDGLKEALPLSKKGQILQAEHHVSLFEGAVEEYTELVQVAGARQADAIDTQRYRRKKAAEARKRIQTSKRKIQERKEKAEIEKRINAARLPGQSRTEARESLKRAEAYVKRAIHGSRSLRSVDSILKEVAGHHLGANEANRVKSVCEEALQREFHRTIAISDKLQASRREMEELLQPMRGFSHGEFAYLQELYPEHTELHSLLSPYVGKELSEDESIALSEKLERYLDTPKIEVTPYQRQAIVALVQERVYLSAGEYQELADRSSVYDEIEELIKPHVDKRLSSEGAVRVGAECQELLAAASDRGAISEDEAGACLNDLMMMLRSDNAISEVEFERIIHGARLEKELLAIFKPYVHRNLTAEEAEGLLEKADEWIGERLLGEMLTETDFDAVWDEINAVIRPDSDFTESDYRQMSHCKIENYFAMMVGDDKALEQFHRAGIEEATDMLLFSSHLIDEE